MLKLEVNGESCEVVPGTTVADLVREFSMRSEGIAVARNREVVPRSSWDATEVRGGDRVEIVTARAGG